MEALLLSPMGLPYSGISDTIEKTLQESNVTCFRIDKLPVSRNIADSVVETIQKSDLIIANVSSNSSNVLFELGIAIGLGKPTLLLFSTDSEYQMPSDLLGYQMAIYNPDNLESLKKQIYRFIEHQKSRWEKQYV